MKVEEIKNCEAFKNSRSFLSLILCGYVTLKIGQRVIWKYRNHRLNNLTSKIVEERDSQIYEFKQVPEEVETKILGLNNIQEIRECLINGDFTCEELVHVYAKRCWTIGRQLNLVTEVNFREAFEMAR